VEGGMARSPSGSADECLEAIAGAVKAVVGGDQISAAERLQPITGDLWRGMPPWSRPPAWQRQATVPTQTRRSFISARAATFLRDGFQCRYCGQRLIPVSLMSVLSLLFPAELPYVSTSKQGEIHRAYWQIGAEADHIVPGSRDGNWIDPDNHAAACVLRNTRKSDRTLAELGWTLRPRSVQSWDGLIGVYRPLWEQAGRPTAGNQRAWMRAFELAITSPVTSGP
jgi:5-methylcytosine-specific restriction endonuclease McrA